MSDQTIVARATTQPPKPNDNRKSPLSGVWQCIRKLTAYIGQDKDLIDYQAERLARIEDRLAKLDGGSDADAARREALTALTVRRVEAGQRAPGFRFVDITGGAIKWLDNE